VNFDPSTIMNLVGQLGGDHQQAAQQLQGMGQVDPEQHAGLLSGLGVDPQQLQSGGYQQHFDAQQQPGFGGYQPGGNYGDQQPTFGASGQQGYGEAAASRATASSSRAARVTARAAASRATASSSRAARVTARAAASRATASSKAASSRVTERSPLQQLHPIPAGHVR